MQQDPFANQIAQAWALHRQGQQREAASAFGHVLQSAADHADALYGLGLVQRALGQLADAKKSFARCHEVVLAAIASDPANNRYQMLDRMTRQRLTEVGASQ